MPLEVLGQVVNKGVARSGAVRRDRSGFGVVEIQPFLTQLIVRSTRAREL